MRVSKLVERLQAMLDEHGDREVYISTWEPLRYQRREKLKAVGAATILDGGKAVVAVIVRD